MSKKRRHYSSDFNSKVALAALNGDQTTSELAARLDIHPTMVLASNRSAMLGVPASQASFRSR